MIENACPRPALARSKPSSRSSSSRCLPTKGVSPLSALTSNLVLLVLGPIIIYVFSTADTVTAVLFMIWSVLVGLSDNLLKPILLGRGVQVPMVVIFIGAIGGFITSGIIGLFVGATILTLGYKLFLAWLREEDGTSKYA